MLETESIEAVRSLGFRFALDGVEDLRLDVRSLADKGVRYAKVPAELLLAAGAGDAPSEIHPADLSDLFARQGMTLIASGIDSESDVVEVQDFSVPLAQGPLFSGPRPVRGEVLKSEPPARLEAEAKPAPQPPTPATGAAAAAKAGERIPFRSLLRRTRA